MVCFGSLSSPESLQKWLDGLQEGLELYRSESRYDLEYFKWSDNAWELTRQILAVSCAPTVYFSGLWEAMPPKTLGNSVSYLGFEETPLRHVSDALRFSGQSIRSLSLGELDICNDDATLLADILALGRLEELYL